MQLGICQKRNHAGTLDIEESLDDLLGMKRDNQLLVLVALAVVINKTGFCVKANI